MNAKPTLVVLILAVAGAIAAFAVWRSDQAASTAGEGPTTIFTRAQLPVDDVNRISLVRGENPPIVFEQTANGWHQTEPFEYPVDPFSMRRLAILASQLERVSSLDGDGAGDARALGLDPPQGVLRFEWSGGNAVVELGVRGIGGRAYVRVAGRDNVYVVRQELHERALDMDPKLWRVKRLFQHASERSSRIVDSIGVIMERDRRTWTITEPIESRIDQDRLRDFLALLENAQFSAFILDQPSDLSRFGLEDPARTLSIITEVLGEEFGVTERLLIGAAAGVDSGDRYGMIEGRPTVLLLSAELLNRLFANQSFYIDPTPSGLKIADVKAYRITTSEHEIRIERDIVEGIERWIVPTHDNRRVPNEVVNRFLDQMTNMRATQLRFEPYPQEFEVAVITFFDFSGSPVDAVRVATWDMNGTAMLLLDNGEGFQRMYPGSLQIPLSPSDYGL